jgi:hypothetical protein
VNEMLYLQLGFAFWSDYLHGWRVEASASASCFASPKKAEGKKVYLNPNEMYKFANLLI